MRHSRLSSLSSFLLSLTAAHAQTWQLTSSTNSPPARASHVMATDLSANRVVMFGGAVGSTYLGDTWEYDGSNWTQVVGTAPAPRAGHAMAWDDVRGSAVLFGGINGVSTSSWFGDTWEYARGTWTQRASTNHPLVRFGHTMAYDRARSRVVMFGGRTRSGTVFLNDTWEWDGTNWIPFMPAHSPAPRMGSTMATDPSTGQVILFGGLLLGGPFAADVWTWDGVDWTQLAPAHTPTARMQAPMANDPIRSRLVLYGGYDGTDLVDTWQWDGIDWHLISTPIHPVVSTLPAITSAPAGHGVVLFGGEDSSGTPHAETWRFDAVAAAQPFGTGCGNSPFVLASAPGSLPLLGQAFTSELGPVPPGGLPFHWLGISNTSWHGVPLPLDLTPYGATGCALYQDAVLAIPSVAVGSTTTLSVALPNFAGFAGIEVYMQGLALVPAANPANLITSNALGLTLGY